MRPPCRILAESRKKRGHTKSVRSGARLTTVRSVPFFLLIIIGGPKAHGHSLASITTDASITSEALAAQSSPQERASCERVMRNPERATPRHSSFGRVRTIRAEPRHAQRTPLAGGINGLQSNFPQPFSPQFNAPRRVHIEQAHRCASSRSQANE